MAVGVYALMALLGDIDRTTTTLMSFALEDWVVILSLSLVNYALRYFRWERYILIASGTRPDRWRHLLIYLAGFAATTTPGKAGEAIRSLYLLRTYNISVSASLSALAVERVMDLLTISLLAAIIAAGSTPFRWVVWASIMVVILVIAVLQRKELIEWAYGGILCSKGRLRTLVGQIAKTLSTSRMLMEPGTVVAGLIAGSVAWACEGVALGYVLHVLGADITVAYAIGVYAVAMLVGALSFMPGGLGSTEVAMTFLLVAKGAPLDVSVAAMLICRVATLWFAVLLGVIALMLLGKLRLGPPANTRA